MKSNNNNKYRYITLKKGDYEEQINAIIKKYFSTSKIYEGSYDDFIDGEPYLFFRGQTNYDWKLTSSISRGNYDEYTILQGHKKEYLDLKNDKLIAHAQHYGKKTRAIDFTSDFKVGLYFACNSEENVDKDGALYIITYCPHLKNYISSLTINLISLDIRKKLSDFELANFLMNNEEYRSLFYKRSGEISEKFICSDYSSYLNSGFMVIYNYVNEKENIRIKKQKGSLFYCGSKYFIENKQIKDVPTVTTEFPQYDIYLHKINTPTWLSTFYVKVKIPKEIKKDVMEYTGLTKDDLAL